MSSNKKRTILLTKLIKETSVFAVVLFALHKYIQHFFLNGIELFHPIYVIHVFLFLSFIATFYFIIKMAVIKPESILTTFFVGSLLKSSIVILFFLPLFFDKPDNLNVPVFNFFIPYFLFLLFEIIQIIKIFKTLK